jgi:hypothetical protein
MKLLLLVCSLLVSCATTVQVTEVPLKYSYLPQKIDLDSLMPRSVVDTNQKDFVSVAIDSGKLITIYKDTMVLHPGVLISEKKASQFIYFKTNTVYLDKKIVLANRLYSELYDRSKESESTYQKEIVLLNKKVERSWLEKNLVYFGFIAGIATAILTEYAILQTVQTAAK